MANDYQLKLIKKGITAWNEWRHENKDTDIDLSRADLENLDLRNAELQRANLTGTSLDHTNLEEAKLDGANLSRANLNQAQLYKAQLRFADLSYAIATGADLRKTDLNFSKMVGTDLRKADLRYAELRDADFTNADLRKADMIGAFLNRANLSGADLSGANMLFTNCEKVNFTNCNLTGVNLQNASLVEINLEGANLADCRVFGISVWAMNGNPKDQTNLIITPDEEAQITVDDLQVAQFIYLLLNNKNLRNVIDTITSKVVLILGRFTEERKIILDAIRDELRKLNFTPILFDFDKPASKDITGTVETLARMARFIIADITNPGSIPHELATLVPHLRTTPIQLIKLEGTKGYSMIEDYYGSYNWLLKPFLYKDGPGCIAALPEIILPANKMAEVFRNRS